MGFRACAKLIAVALAMLLASVTGTTVTGLLQISMSETDANTVVDSGADAQKVKDALAESLAQSIGENPPSIWIRKDMVEIIGITRGPRRRLQQTLRQLSGGKVKVDYKIRVPDGMTVTAVAAMVVAMSKAQFMTTANSKLLAAGIKSAVCPTGPGKCSLQPLKITGMDIPLAPTRTIEGASTAPTGSDSAGLGDGAIVGIVVGVVVVLAILIIVIFMATRKKTEPKGATEKEVSPAEMAEEVSPAEMAEVPAATAEPPPQLQEEAQKETNEQIEDQAEVLSGEAAPDMHRPEEAKPVPTETNEACEDTGVAQNADIIEEKAELTELVDAVRPDDGSCICSFSC